MVGLEGFWGLVLSCGLLYPIVCALPGPDAGSLESPWNGLHMVASSTQIQVLPVTGASERESRQKKYTTRAIEKCCRCSKQTCCTGIKCGVQILFRCDKNKTESERKGGDICAHFQVVNLQFTRGKFSRSRGGYTHICGIVGSSSKVALFWYVSSIFAYNLLAIMVTKQLDSVWHR